MSPKLPANERRRLEALREAALLDTPPEREFDDIAALAAEICGTPIALITLIDGTRQWFKAKIGIDVRETAREVSFCAHALDLDDLLVVPDATADPRFADNPLVLAEPQIRFYAGAPLKTEAGEALGTLCVIDRRAREISERERRALRVLAANVMNLVRLRRAEGQQRQLAKRLGREMQRLADAQAVAKVGSWETDLATLAVTWSAETHRIYETDPRSFVPTHPAFLAIVHPEDRARVDEAFRRSVGLSEPQAIEHRILMPDGRVKLVEERWQVFPDDQGQPSRAVGTCQDVTEQRQAKAERDRLFELSIDMLCVAGFDGRLRQVSPAWTHALGWSAEELTSRPMLDFVHPDDHEATSRTRKVIQNGQAVRGFENRYRAKDGSYHWLSWDVQPFPASRQVFGVARDVTAQRENAEQRRLLEACVSHLNDIVVITEAEPIDEPGPRIIYVNPAFEQLTGYTRAEAIGRSPRFLQGPRTQRSALDEIRHALRERLVVRTELVNYSKSGREYWLEVEVVPVFGSAGRFTHAIAIERDVTGRKVAEETLRRNEALLRMASRVSRLGAWQVEVPSMRMTWSEEVAFIHETPPGQTPDPERGVSFYAPECRDRIRALFEACVKDGTPFDDELKIITARGRHVWVRVLGEAVRDAGGAIVRVQGAIEDISERKAQEEALRRKEKLQQIGGKVARVGGWALKVPENEVFWSDEVFAMLDFPPGQVPLLDQALALYPAEAREKIAAALTECARVGTPFDLELPINTASRRRLWARLRGEAERLPDGTITRIVGAFQDITGLRRAEEQTRRLTERLASTLESITDAFFTVDRSWCFNFLNTEAERLLHRSRSELLGRNIWAEFPAAAGTIIQTEYERAMAKQVTVGFETYYPPLDIWMHVRAYPSEQGLAVYFRDISAERKADEEVKRANASLEGIVDALQEIGKFEGPVEAVMTMMAERAQILTGAAGGVVELLEGEEMVYRAVSGSAAGKLGVRVPVSGSLSGLALQSGTALVCDDSETDPRVDLAACREVNVRAMIVAPLRDAANNVGVLKVMSDQPGAFAERDVKNLQILVETLGAVIQRRQAAERLRASEEQYRMLFADNPHPMLIADEATDRILAANGSALRRYGHREAEFRRLTLRDLRLPDEAQPALPALSTLPPGPHQLGRVRHRAKGGEVFDVEITTDSVMFDGRPARILLAHDISERVRAEHVAARATRALLMHSRCSETLIRASDEAELLRGVCAIAVEVGGFAMAWVGYALNDKAKTIAPQAFAGAEQKYLSEIRLSWSAEDPTGQGPAARALRTGQATVVSDVTDAVTGFSYRDEAISRGFRAVICLPLREGGQAFGLLALYLKERAAPPAEELGVLQDLADDLAFGIRSLQVRAERRRTHEAVLAMARGISAAVGDELFRQLTLSMVEALGADACFVARLDSHQPGSATTLCRVEDGQVVPNFTFELAGLQDGQDDGNDLWVVTRDARRRYPQSRLLAEGRIESFVGKRLMGTGGQPLGLMFVHFRAPLAQPEFVISTLKIFAARAASEIERQAADAKTREQAALLDKARDAIIVRDLDHRITFWNKSAELLYGWSAAEVAGRSVVDLFYVDPTQFQHAQNQVVRAGEWTGELNHKTKGGRLLTVEGRWTLVRDDQGQPRAVLALNTDISERKAMERQLLRTQRMESIGTLAGGIAHDLNNLLAPIMMGVDLLRRDPTIQQRYTTVIDNIRRSTDRGAGLVRQVLSFARGVESAKVALNLRHIIDEVASIVENSFPKNIAMEIEVKRDLPLIVADPTQLNQVLLNLCVNARDAMPGGGRITLTARDVAVDEQYAAMNRAAKPGRYVLLEVADTGTGMTREVMDRIFEPFFTTKEFGKGTGLGLATVMSVARSHGGFVDVYSELGRGSTFKVYLPLQAGVAEATPAAADTAALPTGQGELILVVDDEATIREVTCKTLESHGYQVMTAEDGAQAISCYAANRGRVAVVLTDVMMPVMDGAALSRALHRLDPAVRIVAASGFDASGKAVSAAQLGVKHFLVKPYSASALLKTIRAAIDGTGSGSAHGLF
ncbi:MAG: PAS domain S-box protein [Verrucomicrobia bacterium]|nr:PAS domain S-box protein [Verrucomicrobiota bacterium]